MGFPRFEILDQKVNIRLWGNKVDQIDEDSMGRVVIVTSTTVRKLKEYSLSSTGATKVYIDLDIPETAELQTRYCLEDDIIEETGPEAQAIQEQMLYNRKTLREITEIAYEYEKQEKFYTAEATIKSIDTSDEWYYIGCGKCNKKLQKEGNHFYCPKCEKEPEKTCPRYKLKLEICDHTATTTCTMFETEAKKLIKQSARFLIDRDDCDIHEQAEKFQKICGQKLIFQFRQNDYNFKYGYQDYTVHRIFFMDSEEDSSVQHVNVEQNTTKGTKKSNTRNTCRVVHSDEESEEDSQEKDECKLKESSPKRKRTISITEDEDSEKNGTENYSKTSIRLTGVDKGSKKKGIQNDNHEQVNKLSLSKTIKQESEDDELTIDQTKRGRRRSTSRAAHLDDESKAEGSQEINKSKSMESSPKRKRVVRKCAGVDQEHNDSRPKTRLSCVDKKSLSKGIQKSSVLRTRKTSR
ncbi:replication factor A protein 1-like isoform X3 [Triticum urartu]|uniref:replication factor A protein 1-like isoform X3 n=1 Tax=Triticum urartu TaxID=4572 RepID=UPI002042C308|nr:replication factor A protein 1-like isoform X3 [Triticum urartu]XP_048532800.1 replication factor A protein 1-like isoform X3 [Triticum urartu]XP_048532809.1 replication factor A protein 1-like isoform X3 [Triticum urartu]XP_048532987.1 replication factor A protein 1-like isoform X3 [Triticum urartu]XP_048532995.1 replication factor A protein 1-like isoform X3 [Triticum urartu]